MVVIGERERANLVVQTARFFSLRPTKRRVSAHARLRDALFFTGNCTFLNFTHAQNVIVFILKIASRHGKSILHWAQMANCMNLSYPELLRSRDICYVFRFWKNCLALHCLISADRWCWIATQGVAMYGPRRMLAELEQLTLLHLILENHGIYLLTWNPNKAGDSVWSSYKHSNDLQGSAINGLHPSSHAPCRNPALRHP